MPLDASASTKSWSTPRSEKVTIIRLSVINV
jgi:hypothetical protein